MSSNKPFPSSDLDVFKENSLILDNFVNSQENEHPDRFKRKRPTITGIIKEAFSVRTDISNMNETLIGQSRWDVVPKNTSLSLGGDNGALNKQAQALFNRTVMLKVHTREALRRTYQEVGLNLVEGSFEEGGKLETIDDVLLEEKTGKVYNWTGSFPKVVNKGTLPTSEAEFVDKILDTLVENVVGVDGDVPAPIQVITHRGQSLFTKTTDIPKVGDIVINGVAYRLTPSNVESSSALSDHVINGGCGWPQLKTLEEKMVKSRGAPLQVTVDDVCANRTIKAWRLAEGISDGATAGSFMTGYESEPESQVIGFAAFDKIGSYQARDSVALFSQVQGQHPTALGAFNYTPTNVTGIEIQAQWEKIKVGMILDTNLGNPALFKGAVIIDKVTPYTLVISPWTDAGGNVVSPPTNGTTGVINQRTHLWGLNSNAIVNNGAVQGIGAEIGMMCLTPGSGTNSKVIYAVNLGGETPEFGFYAKGPFRKGYTVLSSEEYAFYSKGLVGTNGSHFRAESPTGEVEYDYGPNGLKYEALDYAYCTTSGELTTRPLSIGISNNLILTMPPLKAGRKLAYKNFSDTPHTVNGVVISPGTYIVFLCDGNSWVTLFKI